MQFVADSSEVVRAFAEADGLAGRNGQPLSSVHLLLALFVFPNRAHVLLTERNLSEAHILQAVEVFEEEPRRTVLRLKERARDIASGAGCKEVDCLHVLIALTRLRDAFAYRVLQRTGTSLSALRNVAVSYVTGNMPRRYRALPRPERSPVPSATDDMPAAKPRSVTAASVAARPEADALPEPSARAAGPSVAEPLPDTFTALPSAAPSRSMAARALGVPARRPPLRLEEIAPSLAACGIDLSERARLGLLDVAIGRDRELNALIDVLGKRRANNPMLVGPPGVGKTAIVEGLAVKIARETPDVLHLRDCLVVALDTGALVAGTGLRGAFSERLGAIKAEVAAANRGIIVFIDELHTLIGAGASGDGPQDAANELKTALARGEFPCIGATTLDEYKKYVERDAALERRFTPIYVDEPSVEEAILILEGAMGPYAEHHGLDFSLEAVDAAVRLAHRFVTERKLPDKAFAVIDLAGSRARRRGARRVERIDVAKVIHEWSGVPMERLAQTDAERFTHAEARLATQFVGHPQVVASVAQAIRRGYAGLNHGRPMGSFLFLGPTGVGKTELVKVMADYLFGRRDAVVRFDMSELSEKHAVARLIGAQPGYVGFEEGGQLTEALRKRPFQIVLFDEIEKAHPDVLNLLLQILDEGHLTDARGRRVSFANTLVVLTSNLGAAEAAQARPGIGFGGAPTGGDKADLPEKNALERTILAVAQEHLSPELWGRLDERLVFLPLGRPEIRRIAVLHLENSGRGLFAERQVTLGWDDAVVDFLCGHGFSPATGARAMRQAITRHVESLLAEALLGGKLRAGGSAQLAVSADGASLVLGRARRRSAAVNRNLSSTRADDYK